MKKIVLIAALILGSLAGSLAGFAQSRDAYRRTVVDSEGRPLDYFNVVVRDLPDSTYVSGEIGLNGRLELQRAFEGRKLVQIQCLGYEDHIYVEDFSHPSARASEAAADTIVMKTAVISVDAVVVSGRVPAVSTSRGKTVVRVAGSTLQHLPDVQDILRRAPGMQVDGGGLTVFGKGTPQVWLDGRESSYEELLLLQPSQIVSIEIDRNPSARYDASYASVVRVRSTRAQGVTSGQISNGSYFGRRFSNSTGAQLQVASEKWINYFSYQYSDSNSHYYTWDTEAIHLPEAPIADSIYSDDTNRIRQHSILYGSTFDITPRHQLLWQYSGTFRKSNSLSLQQERIFQSGDTRRMDADSHSDSNRQSHSANLGYRFSIDSMRTLNITADYARSMPKSYATIAQRYLESGDEDMITIGNRSTADIFSVKAEYSMPLFGAELLTGLRYGHIDSRNTTDYDDQRTTTLLKSDNAAAYATLAGEYTKWGWEAGLRGEFMNDNVRVDGATLREGWENNLFPSLEFYTSELSRIVDLSLSYTSRISRPSVGQLNPSASYINSVVTSYGNPLLRSTISHNVEFAATLWSNLTLSLGANYEIDPSIDSGELSEDGGSIVFKPLNVPRSRYFLVDATYNNSWGKFSMTLDGGIEFPRTEIPYLGETIVVGRPSWYASIDADVRIAPNTSLTGGFEYYGRSYYLMTMMEPANNLTAGITQYLFDRRLQLSLSGYDLLRGGAGSGGNGWRDRYGFYETSQRSSADRRHVRISVRFLFNKHSDRYRQRGGSEESNRVN
ncbi:MAG: outer membrane beta-barrel family protein [Alistipes sp.]|jgi:hypothetical protein|nr:outer membrane beta-barrel family protein [Alistipes sp.]